MRKIDCQAMVARLSSYTIESEVNGCRCLFRNEVLAWEGTRAFDPWRRCLKELETYGTDNPDHSPPKEKICRKHTYSPCVRLIHPPFTDPCVRPIRRAERASGMASISLLAVLINSEWTLENHDTSERRVHTIHARYDLWSPRVTSSKLPRPGGMTSSVRIRFECRAWWIWRFSGWYKRHLSSEAWRRQRYASRAGPILSDVVCATADCLELGLLGTLSSVNAQLKDGRIRIVLGVVSLDVV
ncbi:hypothetical protein BKA70DRAFT_1227264 [Coprinopsis sp. MPI-PUGE-AT-0042]|nr:hypothetical protein BKA70DRAFT_1227264 [Coprinopsis sp. MPI-PUGE-AT-0042]